MSAGFSKRGCMKTGGLLTGYTSDWYFYFPALIMCQHFHFFQENINWGFSTSFCLPSYPSSSPIRPHALNSTPCCYWGFQQSYIHTYIHFSEFYISEQQNNPWPDPDIHKKRHTLQAFIQCFLMMALFYVYWDYARYTNVRLHTMMTLSFSSSSQRF